MRDLKGIHAALVTPYTKEGAVNYPALGQLLDKLILEGADGFFIAGSAGECFLLTREERKEAAAFVLQKAAGRVRTIVHVGSTSTAEAIDLALHARAHGADAVSAVPPFYYKYDFEQIRAHFFAIMDACALPMIYYNYPAFSGVTVSCEDIRQLCAHPGMAGIKHTCVNLSELEQFRRACPGLQVFCGYDDILLGALAMGADGAIGSTYNILLPIASAIAKAFHAGDMKTALAHQQRANVFIEALNRSGMIQGIKYILESKYGIPCNGCRMPMKAISEVSIKELDGLFKQII